MCNIPQMHFEGHGDKGLGKTLRQNAENTVKTGWACAVCGTTLAILCVDPLTVSNSGHLIAMNSQNPRTIESHSKQFSSYSYNLPEHVCTGHLQCGGRRASV